ncbi:MAG TPA: fibronectin type III domain-containing protein [Nitrosopumilaceae archaeon]|nr:fibronectin type III domain-containing protein [Nitrosopumilaceae archaeon]
MSFSIIQYANAQIGILPQPPTNLTATAVSSSEIDLSWTASSDLLISGYMIERSTDGGATWSTIVSDTGNTATTYSDTGLAASTTYTYRVSEVSSIGTSSPSNTASATTQSPQATAPQSPTGLKASTVSSSQINLSWTAPANNGGSAITGYMIERSTDGGTTWSTTVANTANTSTIYSDKGLTASTTYIYRVSAINSVGTSSPSNTASATTSAASTAPQPPTGLAATAASSSQINLSWTAPTSNGGSAITGYKIERSANGGTIWSTIQSNTANTATTYSDTGLAASTTYMYRVSAINAVGTSSPSNTASANTSGTTSNSIVLNGIQTTSGTVSVAPFQITLANFNAGTGTNRVLVVGVEANNNAVASVTFGGVHLTSKVSSFFNNDAEFWYLKNPTGTGNIVVTMVGSTSAVIGAYSFSGIDQSTPIPTSTTNHNSGTGSSPTISITTQNPNSWVLDTPSIYGGVTLGSPTCTKQWDLNIPNAITGASSSTIQSSPGTVTCSWTASGGGDLWDDVAIELKASGTVTTAIAPQPPTGLAATTASSSQINLSWTAPSNNGGSAITGYKIERSTDSGTTWSTVQSNTASTSTTYSDTGLTASTTYTYRVSAINSVGTSSPSNTASATTPGTCTTCKLTVTSQLTTGDPLLGMFSTLNDQASGKVLESGFTPVKFNLTNAAQYTVAVTLSFGTYSFNHWQDGTTSDPRPISISSDTQLTAVYQDISVTLSPSRGPVGTSISVTSANKIFSPNHTITLTWDGTALATATSNSTGGFTAKFTVPSSANGSHKVQATDGTNIHFALFTVGPPSSISLNTSTANVGTGVRVTGSNFAPNLQITFSYDGAALDVGQVNTGTGTAIPLVVTTDSNGGFVAIISIPRSDAGTHTISAKDTTNDMATQSITVTPHVFIYPASGHAGSQVMIPASQGNGFAASSAVTIKFDGTVISSMTTDSGGNFGGSFTIPSGATIASHTIQVSDGKGNTQSVSFSVTDPTTPTYKVQNVTSMSGLVLPDRFAFIPDNGPGIDGSGAFMVIEKNSGKVIVFKNTNGKFVRQLVPFVRVPNLLTGPEDNGLLGIAIDPNWKNSISSQYVYLDITRTISGSNFTEIIRYHATTDPTTGNIIADTSVGEQLVLGNILAWRDGHNGGNLEFDSHGHLYISTGDGWLYTPGQDLTTLQAKLLRITPLASPDASGKLYSIPSDNPFASSTDTSIKKEIWGYGVRNPFSFDIDSQTGKLYVSDPGFNTWERIEDLTTAGSNVGWPNYEAPPFGNPQNLVNYKPPVYWYPHQGMEPQTGITAGLEALTGGVFYHCSANCYTSSNLQGAYFFGDYGVGFIAALLPSSTAPPITDPASGAPKGQIVPIYYGLAYAPIDMQVWNGKLYFLDLAVGSVDVLNYS